MAAGVGLVAAACGAVIVAATVYGLSGWKAGALACLGVALAFSGGVAVTAGAYMLDAARYGVPTLADTRPDDVENI